MCRVLAALAALVLTPAAALAQAGQEKPILEMTKANWVAFRDFNGQQLVYFTHLEAWRCGISAVRFSINSEALDQSYQLQPCDPANPNAITTDRPYIALPLGSAQSVTVQLTYADGTMSEATRFTP